MVLWDTLYVDSANIKVMKIFLADDHPLYRMALSGLLRQLDGDIEIEDCCNFKELQATLASSSIAPDLILLDLCMPGMDYESAIISLKQNHPDTSIVIVSGSEDIADMSKVLSLGVDGYIPKSSSRDVLLSAIRLVLSGGKYIPSQVFAINCTPLMRQTASAEQAPIPLAHKKVAAGLTRRQRNVLDLMAKGYSNREIAAALELAESTVKVHITAIFRTLGVSNRTQAVLQVKEFA